MASHGTVSHGGYPGVEGVAGLGNGSAESGYCKVERSSDMVNDSQDTESTSDNDSFIVLSQELTTLLAKRGLEGYARALVENDDGDVPMLLAKSDAELVDVAADAGLKKKERAAFLELIAEERAKIDDSPSTGMLIGTKLLAARYIKRLYNFCGSGLTVLWMPFRTKYSHAYDYKFPEVCNRPPHRCMLRVLEAQVPSEFIDRDILTELVILVVGATGAGKTTQVDGMLNYLMGMKWQEKVRFKCVDETTTVTAESRRAGKATSQTDAVTVYEIPAIKNGPVPAKVLVVDTPGFGDTRGLEFDQKVVDQLTKFFKDERDAKQHLPFLSGVCFITPASVARLTEAQEYVWTSVLGLFGKDIEENILVCFTFADGQPPQAIAAVQRSGIPMAGHFKFNNSALFVSPDDGDHISRLFWNMGRQSMEAFFTALIKLPAKSLYQTRQVLSERETLEVTVASLGPQIKLICGKADTLRLECQMLERLDDDLVGSQDFTYTVSVDKFKKHPVKAGVNTTTCTTCDWTCHHNCIYRNDDQKMRCCSMKGGYCTACPRKCHWASHQNLPYILEWYQEVETKTMQDLKDRYTNALNSKQAKEEIMEGLFKDIWTSEQVLAQMIMRMRYCQQRLQEIAMRPCAMPSEQYVEMLIQNERNNQKPGFQGRIKVLESLKDKSALMQRASAPDFDPLKDYKSDGVIQRRLSIKQPRKWQPAARSYGWGWFAC
eukprot:TRINITY_DN110784_c0_g1_i1.p1 TRINITY_DN110784_c0_g1~~TRINITY_DN110784_c0_g1_i1.p1  ORF type:complete len:717 (+),score=132.48 TRINITY_DN110784_c0_g1_i1:251-2401(+)